MATRQLSQIVGNDGNTYEMRDKAIMDAGIGTSVPTGGGVLVKDSSGNISAVNIGKFSTDKGSNAVVDNGSPTGTVTCPAELGVIYVYSTGSEEGATKLIIPAGLYRICRGSTAATNTNMRDSLLFIRRGINNKGLTDSASVTNLWEASTGVSANVSASFSDNNIILTLDAKNATYYIVRMAPAI